MASDPSNGEIDVVKDAWETLSPTSKNKIKQNKQTNKTQQKRRSLAFFGLTKDTDGNNTCKLNFKNNKQTNTTQQKQQQIAKIQHTASKLARSP